MGDKHKSLPDGFEERDPSWHFERFVEFTDYKGKIGEPSPHLAIVGHMASMLPVDSKLWLLGCYAATYCLPTAQVIWSLKTYEDARKDGLLPWLRENWPGVVTRTERRCVRTPEKMAECLQSYANWMDRFPDLMKQVGGLPETPETYDIVWASVDDIKYFGRYIAIRFIEGLRRYCGIPARLYDIRSIGGWSPKRALCYLYPQHAATLLVDDAAGNAMTDKLAMDLLRRVRKRLPKVDEYVLAAMLCEYKSSFENHHQYPGWTIDQEPLLYDKVFNYWGNKVDRDVLWRARKALFPPEVLGELNGWNGTRWPLTRTLRDHGYVWSDLLYSYPDTRSLERPAKRSEPWDSLTPKKTSPLEIAESATSRAPPKRRVKERVSTGSFLD